MSGETLYGLDKPDELKELELKDASPKELIRAAYKAWLDTSGGLCGGYVDDVKKKQLYNHACKIVRPFKAKIKGTLHTDDLPIEYEVEDYTGQYLSALLNETGLERLCVNPLDFTIDDIGFRLPEGKIVEVLEGGKVLDLGYYAEGGIVINRGFVSFIGHGATDGIFLNFGEVEYEMGRNATGGMFVNSKKNKRVSAQYIDSSCLCCRL